MLGRFKKTEAVGAPEFLVAGLGNPEKKYTLTRHNSGFLCVDFLAEKHGFKINKLKFKAVIADTVINSHRCIVMKPQTYMNLSGESIAEIVNFYKLDPESEMLIIFDDISLAPGNIRVRKKGSAGGHNGIKSIISSVGTSNFMRIKVGVGEKPQGWDLADHVLGRFSGEDRARVEEAIRDAEDAAVLMIQGEADKAMNDFNAKKQENTK